MFWHHSAKIGCTLTYLFCGFQAHITLLIVCPELQRKAVMSQTKKTRLNHSKCLVWFEVSLKNSSRCMLDIGKIYQVEGVFVRVF